MKFPGVVITILHEELFMENLLLNWVLRLLIVKNKRIRVTDTMAGLVLFRRNPSEFLRRYITALANRPNARVLMKLGSIFTGLR